MQRLLRQKETEVLKHNLCSECSRSCEYSDMLVVFFPQEVRRGLHKMFPFKVMTINGLKIYFFEGTCPYFQNRLCQLYGTEHMPIDCQIYPVTPISRKAYFIDENCLRRKEISGDNEYIRRCMEKTRDTPEDFLEVYKDL